MEEKPQPGAIVPVLSTLFQSCDSGACAARAGEFNTPRGTRAVKSEPGADNRRYRDMRNEEYTLELLLTVGLIAVSLAGTAGLFEARPSSAASPPPAEMARLEPVRVVGTPFVPNIRPSER